MIPKLALVIPCYNEEEVLPETISQLEALLKSMIQQQIIDSKSFVVFIDDGSKDSTWNIIQKQYHNNNQFKGLKLAKNAGHQNALLSGLLHVKDNCDCAISLDVDLQDDIQKIPKFIENFKQGSDVVYGVRSKRDTDSRFKRMTARGFYKIMRKLGVFVVYDHADYRLLSQKALTELEKFPETHIFLRGIIPLIGLNTSVVTYERQERFAGESKYPLKKMIKFALNAITSFSVKPIRLVTFAGFSISLISILACVYTLVSWAVGNALSGWTSLMLSIWFLGGIQILCLGLVGEYIGKIYQEVKQRPRYIIETSLD